MIHLAIPERLHLVLRLFLLDAADDHQDVVLHSCHGALLLLLNLLRWEAVASQPPFPFDAHALRLHLQLPLDAGQAFVCLCVELASSGSGQLEVVNFFLHFRKYSLIAALDAMRRMWTLCMAASVRCTLSEIFCEKSRVAFSCLSSVAFDAQVIGWPNRQHAQYPTPPPH